MDLINEFKEKILCSKELLEKCKAFQKFEKRHLDKGLDDFSCHIDDIIELNLTIENNTYEVSLVETNEEMNDYTYFNIIKEVLNQMVSNLTERKYLASLGIDVVYHLSCYFKFDIKYFHNINKFILKSVESCNVYRLLIIQKTGYEIIATKFDFENEKFILGYSKSEENAKKVIQLLIEERKYLIELDNKIKEDLFEIMQIIRSDKYQILEENSEMFQIQLKKLNDLLQEHYSSYEDLNRLKIEFVINKWLDKNCKISVRNLLEYNKYNYYCSLSDYWLNFVWFLQDNVIINFVKV